ncbi:MAG: hypothetical protein AAFO91_06655, partial [Bacteroidota bacterium]
MSVHQKETTWPELSGASRMPLLVLVLVMSTLVVFFISQYTNITGYVMQQQADTTADVVYELVGVDLVALQQRADEYTKTGVFDEMIAERALLRIADVAGAEQVKYDLDSLLIVDELGVSLSGAVGPEQRGDHIFDTADYGVALVQSGEVATIVQYGPERTALIGGATIGAAEIKGAIVAGEYLDREYAESVKDAYADMHDGGLLAYLQSFLGGAQGDVELIFYTDQLGIVAHTLPESNESLLKQNFNTTFRHGDDKTFPLSRVSIVGEQYNVLDRTLPSEGLSRVGVLTLTPHHSVADNFVYATVAMILIVLLITPLYTFIQPLRTRRAVLCYGALLGVVFVVLLSGFLLRDAGLKELFYDVTKPPYPIYNSTMSFYPEHGVFE